MITLLPTTFILSACLPSFFFSFLLCCFFGTGFNSPSDQFGIHKPLSTLLWKHYLQGMMNGSGDNDYSRTSFPDVVCDRECCHTMWTGWLILTEGMWGMVSFSVPSFCLSQFQIRIASFWWRDLQQFLQCWTDNFKRNLGLPIFYQSTEFFGRQTVELHAFLRETWPYRGMSQTQLCSKHLPKQGVMCVMSK